MACQTLANIPDNTNIGEKSTKGQKMRIGILLVMVLLSFPLLAHADPRLFAGSGYSQYLENEEHIPLKSLVGFDRTTGKVRKYRAGDEFLGIACHLSGYIAGGSSATEHDPHYTLVGLFGPLDFNAQEVIIEGRMVFTPDRKPIGVLLSNGKVFLR